MGWVWHGLTVHEGNRRGCVSYWCWWYRWGWSMQTHHHSQFFYMRTHHVTESNKKWIHLCHWDNGRHSYKEKRQQWSGEVDNHILWLWPCKATHIHIITCSAVSWSCVSGRCIDFEFFYSWLCMQWYCKWMIIWDSKQWHPQKNPKIAWRPFIVCTFFIFKTFCHH